MGTASSGQSRVDQVVDHFVVARNSLSAIRGEDTPVGLALIDRGAAEFGYLADATRTGIEDVPPRITEQIADTASQMASDISELVGCLRSLDSPDTDFEQCETAAPGTSDDLIALEKAMVAIFPFGSRPLAVIVDSLDGPPLEGLPSTASPVAPSTSPPAAAGTIVGSGYRYTAPPGWGAPEQDALSALADTFAMDLDDDDDFTDNVNVLATANVSTTIGAAEKAYAKALRAAGYTDVSIGDRAVVAGSEVPHLTFVGSFNNQSYLVEQFYPTHGDKTFVVTFSFSGSVPPEDRALVTSAVLDSWTWTD